jgi:hypothetical protein
MVQGVRMADIAQGVLALKGREHNLILTATVGPAVQKCDAQAIHKCDQLGQM